MGLDIKEYNKKYYRPKDWYTYYNYGEVYMQEELNNGDFCTEVYPRMMTQQMVVSEWANRLFSDDIVVTKRVMTEDGEGFKYEDLSYNNMIMLENKEIDIHPIISDVLAYGEVLVDIIADENGDKYIYNTHLYEKAMERGELLYAKYQSFYSEYEKGKLIKKNEYIILRFENGENGRNVVIRESSVRGELERYESDYLPCFILDSGEIYKGFGQPIYSKVINHIDDADVAFVEKITDRSISRKLLVLPTQMGQSARDRVLKEGKSVSRSNKQNRLFYNWNVDEECKAKPEYYNGEFNPQSYIDDINSSLKLIGLGSGLGSGFMSFDSMTGVKTAEEINGSRKDSKVTLNRLRNIVRTMIKQSIIRILELEINDNFDLEYDVEFISNIYSSLEEERANAQQEVVLGLLSPYAYWKMQGKTDEEIELLVPATSLSNPFESEFERG